MSLHSNSHLTCVLILALEFKTTVFALNSTYTALYNVTSNGYQQLLKS